MSYFKIGQVKTLIQRLNGDPNVRELCGFATIPGKAIFSRNVTELTNMDFLHDVLDRMVKAAHRDTMVFHISRDSMTIEAREKAEKERWGRPNKGETRLPVPENKLERQVKQSAEGSIKELDIACSYGGKKNRQGTIDYWKGYTLPLDIRDRGFPLGTVITGTNVYDSQLAIPMEKMLEEKFTFATALWMWDMTRK
jgi:hypothetical protein